MASLLVREMKKRLYFTLARYFRYWARLRLLRWKPLTVVITGSNGKTTTLHLAESQLKGRAHYSHKANSAYGIPFDILHIHRKSYSIFEWIYIALIAPFRVFSRYPNEKIYVIEADCDRPHEGKFSASLIKPDIVIWLSSATTHSEKFDNLSALGAFSTIQEAIAYEFGFFIEYAQQMVIYNDDSSLIRSQLHRTHVKTIPVTMENLKHYLVSLVETRFEGEEKVYALPYLLPKATYYSIKAVELLTTYLSIPFDPTFHSFLLPPGRSSVFQGINQITILDSTYNANLASMTEILSIVKEINYPEKIAVLGDMIELGKEEKTEHEALAELLLSSDFRKIFFVGPRMKKYVVPLLENRAQFEIYSFEHAIHALPVLEQSLSGGEFILFKGARFLEGIIEHLLLNPEDKKNLSRRERIWERRRKQWGF